MSHPWRAARIVILIVLGVAPVLQPVADAAQAVAAPLHTGEEFPQLSGQSLTGKSLELPSMIAGKPAVVVFSFSRSAGKDARSWNVHLSQDFPSLSINTIILLESVPSLFRGMALSGIKSGIPSSMQDRTVVLYKNEELWKQRLDVTDENRAYLVLVGPDGHIRWKNSAGFTGGAYAQLQGEVRKLQDHLQQQ